MQVIFYNNKSDNDEVHKNIITLVEKDCKLYEDCSIQSPRFIVNMDNTLLNANYIRVPKFNRYYYITNLTIKDGTIAVIDCKVDVLMSFWDEFKNSNVIASRSSSKYDVYLPDNMITYSTKMRYETRKLPFTFSPTENGNHYLLTLGGNI